MRYVTIKQAAALLGISVATFYRVRDREPDFPKAIRYSGSVVRYAEAELIAWLESRKAA